MLLLQTLGRMWICNICIPVLYNNQCYRHDEACQSLALFSTSIFVFQKYLDRLRKTDDRINSNLNSTVPTASFEGKVDPTNVCKGFYDEVSQNSRIRYLCGSYFSLLSVIHFLLLIAYRQKDCPLPCSYARIINEFIKT